MPRIFISYRRDDSAGHAGRLKDRLGERFGQSHLFIDIDKIYPGADFPRVIQDAVASCNVLIAVIGKQWLTVTDEKGGRRLDNSEDFVRQEIAAALAGNTRVIPVLVQSASMPNEKDLPEDLRSLTHRHAIDLSDGRWDSDVKQLIEAILRKPSPPPISLRDAIILTVIAVGLGATIFGFTSLLDYFSLDTKAESYTIWLGNFWGDRAFTNDLVMVTADQTLDYSERRRRHADIVERLSKGGAKVIAFDMFFESSTEHDSELRRAIEKARGRGTEVIVGVRDMSGTHPTITESLHPAVSAWGIICLGRKEGYAWIQPIAIERQEQRGIIPSLALSAVAEFWNLHLESGFVDSQHAQLFLNNRKTKDTRIIQFSDTRQVESIQSFCPAISERGTIAELILNLSPLEVLKSSSRRVTYAQVLTPTVDVLPLFKEKIVLIGAEDSKDSFRMGLTGEQRFGFELHADAINTLLNGIAIRSAAEGTQFFISVCMALVGGSVRYWYPLRSSNRRIAALILASCVYLVATTYIYSQYRILFNSLYHVGALACAYILTGKVDRTLSQRFSAAYT